MSVLKFSQIYGSSRYLKLKVASYALNLRGSRRWVSGIREEKGSYRAFGEDVKTAEDQMVGKDSIQRQNQFLQR